MCAEATAIACMISNNGLSNIENILIISSGQGPCPPCGACRQRIAEFSTKRTTVHLANLQNTEITTHQLSTLLPLQFDSGMLE